MAVSNANGAPSTKDATVFVELLRVPSEEESKELSGFARQIVGKLSTDVPIKREDLAYRAGFDRYSDTFQRTLENLERKGLIRCFRG